MLLPVPADDLSDADLDAAYSWPGDPDRLPWLRANMVSTVDGAARSPDGLSATISSDADRRVFGRLRGLADLVLAGAGTARAEGYRPARVRPELLERRRAAGQADVPVIALVSRSLDLDLRSDLFAQATARTVVVTCAASDPARRARVADVADVVVAGGHDVDLVAAVAALRERGLVRVHAEGGPHLLADLAAAGLLDELLLTVSPLLAGGSYSAHGQDGPSTQVPRILAGAALPDAPRALRLHHVLEDADTLFLSYRRSGEG
jgi:riboflavin biosynthesis pyrimidine reductase